MPVGTVDQFEGHGSRPVVGILCATSRAKFGMAAKRDELEVSTMWTAIHGQ